jgi:hypothetical protein
MEANSLQKLNSLITQLSHKIPKLKKKIQNILIFIYFNFHLF